MKKVLVNIETDLHKAAIKRIDKEKKSGELSDRDGLSSVIRRLIRDWLAGKP